MIKVGVEHKDIEDIQKLILVYKEKAYRDDLIKIVKMLEYEIKLMKEDIDNRDIW